VGQFPSGAKTCAHVLNIKGRSYRLRDLEQALSTQRP
jgi:hypothetical protein